MMEYAHSHMERGGGGGRRRKETEDMGEGLFACVCVCVCVEERGCEDHCSACYSPPFLIKGENLNPLNQGVTVLQIVVQELNRALQLTGELDLHLHTDVCLRIGT